jgi:nucleoside-diphosphate-sugar epimerase
VIPNFVIPALKNEPLTIYGSGEQIMDFIYAEDLAEILCRALLCEHNVYDKVFEAGSGNMTTINYIAEKIILLAESASKIKHEQMRPGEVPESVVVANTATLIPLDYKLSEMMSLDEGLEKTIQYYRENLQNYN